MDSSIIEDLKQYISVELKLQTTQVNAQLRELEERIDKKIDSKLSASEERIDKKIDSIKTEMIKEIEASEKRTEGKIENAKNEILEAVGETFNNHVESNDKQISNLDMRVTRLEQRTA